MATAENLYSQAVSLLKILLPIGALALLSTIFLFAKAPITDGEIPFAEIEEIAREPRISGAQISGVAADGSVIEMTAQKAQPDGAIIRVTNMTATLISPEGVTIEIRSGEGQVNNSDQTARLSGLARMVTSNGYEMETSALSADLESGRIASDGSLEARTPFGELTAGQMIVETPEEGGGQRMLFQGGVRLLYQPQQQD